MSKATRLLLAELRRDGGTQPRAGLTEATVAEYAEAMVEGATFPPVTVFFDGTHYWLADGFHRVAAAERVGRRHIQAEVRSSGRREAVLYAAGANATHGLRRTNTDKRRAVALLLQDEEWGQWSDREIARRCGVSPSFVGNLRGEVSVHGEQIGGARRLVERGGTVYEMDTTGIRGGEPGTGQLNAIEKNRLGQSESVIDRGLRQARQIIRELEGMGVTLTATDARLPPGMFFEDWRRGLTLLVNLRALTAPSHIGEKEAAGADSSYWMPDTIVLDPEFRDLLPACTSEENAALDDDIQRNGVAEPLVIWPGPRILVDGYRRLESVIRHGLPYRVALIEFESRGEAIAYRLREQLLRMSLSVGDRKGSLVDPVGQIQAHL